MREGLLRWFLTLAFLGCGIALFAAHANAGEFAAAEELRHECGLQTIRPQGFRATMTATGYVFDEEGDMRTPKQITIGCSTDEPALGSTPEERWLAGTKVNYSTEELGGGSGGTEYLLIASKRGPSGWIVMTQHVQIELSQPDFLLGWAVLERSQLAAK